MVFIHLESIVGEEELKAGRDVIWNDLGYNEEDPSNMEKPSNTSCTNRFYSIQSGI